MSPRFFLLIGCLLLSGCQESSPGLDTLNRYLERLSGATEIPLETLPPSRQELAPPKLLKTMVPPAEQIDLIDFLSLSGCELQVNLGRRNSQLGRSASPSQRLLLDLEFLRLAPACIDFLRQQQDDTLADALERTGAQRQQWLPLAVYEAVLAGPEWQDFWSTPTTLTHYPQQTDTLILQTLAKMTGMIEAWVSGHWTASNREFELLLSELRAGDGGALLLSMDRVTQQLARANDLLNRTRQEKPLCPYGKETERSRAVRAVVQRFFVSELQPWLVQLRKRKELLAGPITALETPLRDVQPQLYRDWTNRRDALLENQSQVIRQHVHTIQQALSECRDA